MYSNCVDRDQLITATLNHLQHKMELYIYQNVCPCCKTLCIQIRTFQHILVLPLPHMEVVIHSHGAHTRQWNTDDIPEQKYSESTTQCPTVSKIIYSQRLKTKSH